MPAARELGGGRHHVGVITGQTLAGTWIVHSGNDGGAARTRPRSLAGV